MVPERAEEDSKWIGMEEVGWDSCRTTKEARLRGHLMITLFIRQDLHEPHGCVAGVAIKHYEKQ